MSIPTEALSKLQAPFAADEIELLPKYTGKKVDGKIPRDAYKSCQECGGYHPFPCVHLSYVGHAGITMRLLEVDPEWTWEPLALNANGTPQMADGGMWIRLTVLGITRLGFGDADGKNGPSATKELIGDAIRNAAMRFGVGTYLWSKSDAAKSTLLRGIQGQEPEAEAAPNPAPKAKAAPKPEPKAEADPDLEAYKALMTVADLAGHKDAVKEALGNPKSGEEAFAAFKALGKKRREALQTLAESGPAPESEEVPF